MVRESYLDFEVQGEMDCRQNCDRGFSRQNYLEMTVDLGV